MFEWMDGLAVTVKEIYSAKSQLIFQNDISTWPKIVESPIIENIWKRRSNLRGLTLKHVTLDWVGYVATSEDPFTGEVVREGSTIDVIKLLQKMMHFEVVYYEPEDKQVGCSDWGRIIHGTGSLRN